MHARQLRLLLFATLLAACAPQEVLLPISGKAPAGIDFSGYWQLRTDAEAEERRLDDAIRKTDGVDNDDILRSADLQRYGREREMLRGRELGGLVYVFLEHGRQLKITQTESAIFISFDRAVVEEFRFGENREVHVGPVIADRVSGWEGETYVVETLDKEGMKLTERLAFGNNRDSLRRTIILRGSDQKSVTLVQEFDRTG